MTVGQIADAARATEDGTFDRTAPPQLVGRYQDILAAALALAWAARPRGTFGGAVEYWKTLSASQRNSHMLRAVHDTAQALRIPFR